MLKILFLQNIQVLLIKLQHNIPIKNKIITPKILVKLFLKLIIKSSDKVKLNIKNGNF